MTKYDTRSGSKVLARKALRKDIQNFILIRYKLNHYYAQSNKHEGGGGFNSFSKEEEDG